MSTNIRNQFTYYFQLFSSLKSWIETDSKRLEGPIKLLKDTIIVHNLTLCYSTAKGPFLWNWKVNQGSLIPSQTIELGEV